MFHTVIISFPNSPELYYSDENQVSAYLTQAVYDINNGLAEIIAVGTGNPEQMINTSVYQSRSNIIIQLRLEENQVNDENEILDVAGEFVRFCNQLRVVASNNHQQVIEPYYFDMVFEVFDLEEN